MKTLILALLFSVNAYSKLDSRLMSKYNKFIKEVQCKSIITSGYRTKEHNKRVGGSKNSYHLKGKALDVAFTKCDKSLKEIGIIAQSYFNGVIVYKKHIHIDIRDKIYHNEGKY